MIDIDKAQQSIIDILPHAKSLGNSAITTKGVFVVFHSLTIDNPYTSDIGYIFRLYVAINSLASDKRTAYTPLSQVLAALITDYQQRQLVAIQQIKPFATKGLIIYEVSLKYKPVGVVHVEDT